MGLSPWGLVDGTWLEKVRVCVCGLEGFQSHGILSLLLLLDHFADPSVFFSPLLVQRHRANGLAPGLLRQSTSCSHKQSLRYSVTGKED